MSLSLTNPTALKLPSKTTFCHSSKDLSSSSPSTSTSSPEVPRAKVRGHLGQEKQIINPNHHHDRSHHRTHVPQLLIKMRPPGNRLQKLLLSQI